MRTFRASGLGFVSRLTFLDLLHFVVLAGAQQSEDDAGLRVEADGRHHHSARSLHDMGPWGEVQETRVTTGSLSFASRLAWRRIIFSTAAYFKT